MPELTRTPVISVSGDTEEKRIGRKLIEAWSDVFGGVINLSFWYVMGLAEVKNRYRRSVIGPLWITISQGISAIVIGFVMGRFTGANPDKYIPWVVFSTVFWAYITAATNDGANAFISNASTIISVRRPAVSYVMLSIWRSAIVLLHSITVFIIVYIVYHGQFALIQLMFIPGFILLTANLAWIALLCGILGARYRDVPIMIQNLFTILFWLTPVIFYPGQIKGGVTAFIFEINPLTYLLDIVRDPIINLSVDWNVWLASLAIFAVGWSITIFVFARTRARIPYWM